MASNHTERIAELERKRKQNLRQAKRARERRRQALRKGNWKQARSSRRTAARNNREAQQNLRDVRTLRRARSQANRLARLVRHRRPVAGHPGIQWFDGKMVRGTVVPHLKWARANGWRGVVVSGYRTPSYSRSLCYAMCGAPRCPGRCAGDSSNHVRTALDVSDWGTFGNLMKRCPYKPRLWNNLPHDRVHYSPNGH